MTREEAIKVLDEWSGSGAIGEDCWIHFESDLDDVDAAMEMAIASLREQPRWISVEERLPDRCEVIAFSKQYGDYLLGWLTKTETEGVVCYGDGVELYCVTHWMPLPEPPEVEG